MSRFPFVALGPRRASGLDLAVGGLIAAASSLHTKRHPASWVRRFVASSLACAVLSAAASAPAQEFLVVNAVSNATAARWAAPDVEPSPLVARTELSTGVVEVLSGAEIMLFNSSGQAVLIALGPCQFSIEGLEDRVIVDLSSGRLLSASKTRQHEQKVEITTTAENLTLTAGPVGHGWTAYAREGSRVQIAYVSDNGESDSLRLRVRDQDSTLATGQLLTLDASGLSVAAAGAWLTESGFDTLRIGQRVGVSQARISRLDVQDRLFLGVVEWDQRAPAEVVIPTLETHQFRPEVRAVAIAVTGTPTSATNQFRPFQGITVLRANEVPLLSPAAISVVGGVTAVLLNNQQARNLLNATGSRGLGFNGLSQLAIPGFLVPGIRTPGPPGLGAAERSR